MSTLETNSIAKYSGNNVSIDDSLNLKSYTTTQRDALTSAAGDMIYNSTTSKVQYFDGSSWVDTGSSFFNIEYLAVAGGGSGGGAQTYRFYSGGGGAGGGGDGGGSGGVVHLLSTESMLRTHCDLSLIHISEPT